MKDVAQYQAHFESFLLTEKRVARNTFDAYKKDIEQFLQFLHANKIDLEDCAKPQLQKFLRQLKTSGMTAKSIARKISTLKLFFTFLHERFKLADKGATLIFPKIEQTLPTFLTEEEIQSLFDAANKDNSYRGIRNKVMLSLLYASGMRVSELVNMTTDQIHFDTGFIRVVGKGGKERMVPVPQNVLELLRYYIDIIQPKLLPKSVAEQGTKYLFAVLYQNVCKPISRQLFWTILKKILSKADIKKNISPHSLRHSLATHLLKKGANIRLLQVLLGHEQLSTVQVYTHLESSHLRAIYDKKHPRA